MSGGVTLGNANFLGAASVVLPCRTVKENVVLGANSTLVRDALVGGTYAGCPAVLKKKPSPAPEKKSHRLAVPRLHGGGRGKVRA